MSRSLEAWPGCPCLDCGRESSEATLTGDHLLPQCLVGSKALRRQIFVELRQSRPAVNPLYPVIYDNSNIFPLCEDCHIQVDRKKTSAFLTLPIEGGDELTKEERIRVSENISDPNRGDPVALILALYDYPITDNRQFFNKQRRRMRFVMNRFIKATRKFPPEFDPNLARRYEEAAIEARSLSIILKELKEPGRQFINNFNFPIPIRGPELIPVRAMVGAGRR